MSNPVVSASSSETSVVDLRLEERKEIAVMVESLLEAWYPHLGSGGRSYLGVLAHAIRNPGTNKMDPRCKPTDKPMPSIRVSSSPPEETRVRDHETGGEKCQKPEQYSTLHFQALDELARVGAYGCSKYSKYNYLRGYAWSLSADALMRHFSKWSQGEDYDEESGCHHMACVAWHALALVSFCMINRGTDDRFKK